MMGIKHRKLLEERNLHKYMKKKIQQHLSKVEAPWRRSLSSW
jgi:hypothetical protein